MSQSQRDDYYVLRGRRSSPVRSRGRYSSRLLTHSPVRTERCLSLSPSREITALDRERSLLPATNDDRKTRSLSLNDLHCYGDPKCILPAELHDGPELCLDRISRKLAPAPKPSRKRVPLYEPSSSRAPLRASSLSIVYGRGSRLLSYESLEPRVRLQSYERKLRPSRSPSVVCDSTGDFSRSDRRKSQHLERRHSSPARYTTFPRPVSRPCCGSLDIRTYRSSESPHRGSPRVIPRRGSSTTARPGRPSPRDIEISSRPPSKNSITRITMPSTGTRRSGRPTLKEMENEAKPIKKVRFIDDKSNSRKSKTSLSSTSLVVRRKKSLGTSALSTIAQPPSTVRARIDSKAGGRTLPGDPVLRRRIFKKQDSPTGEQILWTNENRTLTEREV